MGQDKRARLWIPSLIAALAAAACGGTSVGEPIGSGADAGAGAGSMIGNPPPSVGGYGTTAPPTAQGGYASISGAGGATPIIGPNCPVSVPQNGSSCYWPNGNYQCEYDTGAACTTTFASCTNGSWSLGGYDIECGYAGSPGYAGEGGAAPIESAGAGGDAPVEPPTVSCPSAVPSPGAYCYKPSAVTSYLCNYSSNCGTFEATCNDHWLVTFHDGPAGWCEGGAPAY